MKTYLKTTIYAFFLLALITGISFKTVTTDDVTNRIRINSENPFYWEYKGEPVLLLGGSREDNIFNHPEGLAEHLDLLKSVGGNYIRNTMSSRNPGNPWPHKVLKNGLYDLTQWNEEYWHRFENLLKLCLERDIIVQIEIWDTWDYLRAEVFPALGINNVGWESCPYNPKLNINYTAEESGLATEIEYRHTGRPSGHSFFLSVPALNDIPVIRVHQEAFIDKLLSISLKYPNVLYCMTNETGEHPEWGEYWATFIRNRAKEAGKEVFLADMRDNWNFNSEEQIKLLHDRVHYDFFEISQNNHNNDQNHYDQIMSIRDQVIDQPKPLNNIKIYGGERLGRSPEEGTRRLWRNIFGGSASARFHRPGPAPFYWGAGLTDLAQTHIRSMRMFTDEMDIFKTNPSYHLLSDRVPNKAYCLAEEGKQYAVYFPDGGEVMMDFTAIDGELEIRWMNIVQSAWLETKTIKGNQQVMIVAPARGQWAVLIKPKIK